MGQKRARIRQCLYGMAAVGLLAVIGVAGLITSILHYAGELDEGTADAAVVLGAAVWGDKPSPVFAERIRHAIGLIRSGRVRALIFTGGMGEGDTVTESEAGRAAALAEGIAPADVQIETNSRTTLQNLVEARKIIRRQGWGRVLIVSDPLHMRRAIAMARDLGIDAHPSPTPTTRYRSVWIKSGFLLREVYFLGRYVCLDRYWGPEG